MKKFLCVLISLFLVMSSVVLSVYGEKGGNGKSDNPSDKKNTEASIDVLKDQLKANHKDKEKRKDIINQIVSIKRQNGDKSIIVFMDGEEVVTDVPPVIKYGRTLIPVRAITNGLGADLTWNQDTQTITITKDKIVVVLKLGSNIAAVNGIEVKLEAPAEAINNRTMVPLRFLADIFKKNTEWDNDSGIVIIEDDENTVNTVNDNTLGSGNNQFEYVGGWNYGAQIGAYLQDNHWSNYAGSYYQIRFVGTQIKLYGAKNSNCGIAGISVDGGAETLVNLYSPNRTDNKLLYTYTSPISSNMQHILKVRMTGTKDSKATDYYITADKVEIFAYNPTPTATPTPTSTPTTTPSNTPTPSPANRYEAENAVLTGGTFISNSYTGYSGTGFVGGYLNAGASTTFIVNTASVGIYNVTLRYANATVSAKSLSIYVNGVKAKQTSLPNLATWNTWFDKTETLALNPGSNAITYKYDTGDGGNVNLDCITIHALTVN